MRTHLNHWLRFENIFESGWIEQLTKINDMDYLNWILFHKRIECSHTPTHFLNPHHIFPLFCTSMNEEGSEQSKGKTERERDRELGEKASLILDTQFPRFFSRVSINNLCFHSQSHSPTQSLFDGAYKRVVEGCLATNSWLCKSCDWGTITNDCDSNTLVPRGVQSVSQRTHTLMHWPIEAQQHRLHYVEK